VKRLTCVAGLTCSKHVNIRICQGGDENRAPVVAFSAAKAKCKHSAGQWVFICIPQLGLLHWHPFTISSSAQDDDLSLHFDCSGKWTSKVAALAKTQDTVQVLIHHSSAHACLVECCKCAVLQADEVRIKSDLLSAYAFGCEVLPSHC
jgi:predicted ferric reductase